MVTKIRGGQYRGTFLVPLPVPSVLFQHSTVFGTVGTFLARLPRYWVLLCGLELKSFKSSSVVRGGGGGSSPPLWLVKYAKSDVLGAFEAEFW